MTLPFSDTTFINLTRPSIAGVKAPGSKGVPTRPTVRDSLILSHADFKVLVFVAAFTRAGS